MITAFCTTYADLHRELSGVLDAYAASLSHLTVTIEVRGADGAVVVDTRTIGARACDVLDVVWHVSRRSSEIRVTVRSMFDSPDQTPIAVIDYHG